MPAQSQLKSVSLLVQVPWTQGLGEQRSTGVWHWSPVYAVAEQSQLKPPGLLEQTPSCWHGITAQSSMSRQRLPDDMKPALQLQVNEPGESAHVALASHTDGVAMHSSMFTQAAPLA